MENSTGVLISPLDWGLGHAARCIPLIRQFLSEDRHVTVFASEGICGYLQERFPDIEYIQDKTQPFNYGLNGTGFFRMIGLILKIRKQLKSEQMLCSALCSSKKFDLIVSDNRYGFRCDAAKSVLITHQLGPVPPWWLRFGMPVLRRFLEKTYAAFSEVWVPDYENYPGLAGKLSHPMAVVPNAKYLGPFSRFEKRIHSDAERQVNSILVIASGPEKHRIQMAEKLSVMLAETGLQVTIAGADCKRNFQNITCLKFASDELLGKLISEAGIIISHAGYSTLMDLFSAGRSAIIFPTHGQTEQKYLADLHKDCFVTVSFLNGVLRHLSNIADVTEILKQKEIRLKSRIK